jgi:outer membrane immunogenic protein
MLWVWQNSHHNLEFRNAPFPILFVEAILPAAMKHLLCLCPVLIATITVSESGWAAEFDLPLSYGYPVAAAPFAAWTGCFLGGNGGLAVGRRQLNTSATKSKGGISVGGQLGCDYQVGPWTIGVQGMLDGTSLRDTMLPGSVSVKDPLITTATGRIGYSVAPSILAYARGGRGWSQQEQAGWTVGVGLDWKFLPNMALFAEYDHMGFGAKNVTSTTTPPVLVSYKTNLELFLVGLNYRLDFPSRVTTRY